MKSHLEHLPSRFALAMAGIVFVSVYSASAEENWVWSYTGDGLKGGSGTFISSDARTDGATFLVTAMTGTFEDQAITALVPPRQFKNNDNLVYDRSHIGVAGTSTGYGYVHFPPLSDKGVAFETGTKKYSISLFSMPPAANKFLVIDATGRFTAMVRFSAHRIDASKGQ